MTSTMVVLSALYRFFDDLSHVPHSARGDDSSRRVDAARGMRSLLVHGALLRLSFYRARCARLPAASAAATALLRHGRFAVCHGEQTEE